MLTVLLAWINAKYHANYDETILFGITAFLDFMILMVIGGVATS